MSHDDTTNIAKLGERICALQKSYIGVLDEFKQTKNDFDRTLNNSALGVIDILDMLDNITLNLDLENADNAMVAMVINKIGNRLNAILRQWQVQEIKICNDRIEPGKVRVLETQPATDKSPAGVILKVCRKGYCRGDKIIRPADVISAS